MGARHRLTLRRPAYRVIRTAQSRGLAGLTIWRGLVSVEETSLGRLTYQQRRSPMTSSTIVSRTISLSGRSGIMQPANLENLGPGHAGRANFWVPALAGMAAIPSPLALITL